MNEPVEKEEQESEVQESEKRSNTYSDEELRTLWDEYVVKIDKEGLLQEALILKDQYQKEGNLIRVSISNEALEGRFEKVRGEMTEFLRNQLKNDHITIRGEVKEIDHEQMLYTDKEKFEHLKKKYPALKELQEKLGLDPEF